MNKPCTFLMVCLFVSLGGAVCVWGGDALAVAITSADALPLSVFTQMQDTAQRLNVLIITTMSSAYSPQRNPLTTVLIAGRGRERY